MKTNMADSHQVCTNRGSVSEYRKECHSLLLNLKTTVEGLLALPCTNVWQTFGGLDRVANKIESILSHRLKTTQSDGQDVFWHFIRGLRWLNPSAAPSVDQLNRNATTMKGQRWLRENLESHNLSSQLSILVANRQHLLQHYHAEAFLCQPDYFYAMLVCLQAVEQNSPAILAEINPAMLYQSRSLKRSSHVRSSSLPFIALAAEAASSLTSLRLPHPDFSHNISLTRHLASKDSNVTRQCLDSDSDIRLSLYDNTSLDMSFESNEPESDHVIERINDPLMNFYATSSTEKLKRSSMKLGTSISSEMLDGLSGLNVPITPLSTEALLFESVKNVSPSNDNTLSKDLSSDQNSCQKHCENLDDEKKIAEEREDVINNDDQIAQKVRRKVICRAKERDNKTSRSRPQKYDFPELLADGDSTFSNDTWTEVSHVPRSDQLNIDLILNSDDFNLCSDKADSGIESLMSKKSVNLQNSSSAVSRTNLRKSQNKTRSSGERNLTADSPVDSDRRRAVLLSDSLQSNSFTESLPIALSSSLPSKANCKTERTRQQGFFRAPLEGQSLLSFLSSQDFHTCTDLERERAHFSIAEALIAAVEQMKWNHMIAPKGVLEHEECDSDEEIQLLKQRIRIRRTERLKEKARQFPGGFDPDFEVVCNGTGETSQSDSFPSFESLSPEGDYSSSSEDVQDAEINDIDEKSGRSNLVSMRDGGLSLSMASLYSDADLRRSLTPMSTGMVSDRQTPLLDSLTLSGSLQVSQTSADSIAISLLKQFSEKQLPKASELLWLVSERDAPQQLLPLPDSYPISPDDGENADLQPVQQQNRLRGNLDWAPPRPQIISSIHPKLRQSVVIARQNHRCAGCGSKVEKGYVRRYRYCEYLGKYFCQCCHSNDRAYVPGRILRKWDFGKYYVSHFAHEFLKSIYEEPVFSVESKTTGLYQKVPALDELRELRIQLFYLAPFVQTCKQKNKPMLDNIPSHWLTSLDNIHYYSLAELVEVKKKELLPRIREVVSNCITHISQCLLCHGKGFVCEICRNGTDVIFPFEIGRVVVCPGCRSAFHQICYKAPGNGSCPKCTRIQNRKRQKLDRSGSSSPVT